MTDYIGQINGVETNAFIFEVIYSLCISRSHLRRGDLVPNFLTQKTSRGRLHLTTPALIAICCHAPSVKDHWWHQVSRLGFALQYCTLFPKLIFEEEKKW